ncbi:hypothetical protein [Streptomyces sp. HSG2]|uniref:hypothetical protein n=1 Tax=Streptomyces sp. HSG2 TaxID=2797167 RepID=UPI001908B085|nr:hypothetical protein [Streptomyces sp. HSG2]
MGIWLPEADETLIARAHVVFATGIATPVKNMRWFRDIDRKDIQEELDWPEGPTFTARSKGGIIARNTARFFAITTGLLLAGWVSSHANDAMPNFSSRGSKVPKDPADEVDDFPVMWAAPNTLARTLPWQMDPGRCKEKKYRTHAVITDRRLLIVGFPHVKGQDKLIDDEVLWQTPRSAIEKVELRDFRAGGDAKILFTDGSWCRVSSRVRERLTRYLIEPLDFIPLTALTPEQRRTAEDFAKSQGPDAQAPLVKLNPCGCYRIEAIAPSRINGSFGHGGLNTLMDASGRELPSREYHPDDFLT